MNSLPPEQRTIVTATAEGYLREAIPGMEVCDFCSKTPVRWAYPCGEVVLGPTVTSDPWAACDDCHTLIESDDRPGLAARAAREMPGCAPLLAEFHRRFFAARTGTARRVTP